MRDTTKADLAAANREVRAVTDQNIELKKQAQAAYQNGYRDALQALDNIARTNQAQAGMIIYLATLHFTPPDAKCSIGGAP